MGPRATSNGTGTQERKLWHTSTLLTDVVLHRIGLHRVGVEGSVEVEGNLNDDHEDHDGQDEPSPPCRVQLVQSSRHLLLSTRAC